MAECHLYQSSAGLIVSVAVIIASGVNGDRRCQVLGMDIRRSEAELFWTEILRKLTGAACVGSNW